MLPSVEVAAVGYAHIVKILGDTPPTVAAEYYARKHPSKIVAKSVPVVVQEFLEAKEADGGSRRYLNALKYNLGAFKKRFQGNIESVAGRLTRGCGRRGCRRGRGIISGRRCTRCSSSRRGGGICRRIMTSWIAFRW